MVSSPADRSERSYPSDLTDQQWDLVAPLVATDSQAGPGSKGGRPPKHSRRRILEAILYVNRAGCQWRMLPHDFPPYEVVFGYFQRWAADGTTDRVLQALRDGVRDSAGRDPAASAGVVDSASVRAADTVADPRPHLSRDPDARGYDAGKKVNGRKRHVVVDTLGLLIAVVVTSAAVQDRDGGVLVLDQAKMVMPSLVLVWADGAYSRRVSDFAARALRITVAVVSKEPGQKGFAPLPRRWVVERSLAWMSTCRRLVRDYERRHTHAEAMAKWSGIALMLRRLAPAPGPRPWTRTVTS